MCFRAGPLGFLSAKLSVSVAALINRHGRQSGLERHGSKPKHSETLLPDTRFLIPDDADDDDADDAEHGDGGDNYDGDDDDDA